MDKDVEANIIPVIHNMSSSNDALAATTTTATTTMKNDMNGSCEIEKKSSTSISEYDRNSETMKILNSTNNNVNSNKDSFTHSQISMISKDDHGSHLYSSPESISNEGKRIIPAISKEDMLERQSNHTKKTDASPIVMHNNQVQSKRAFPTHIVLGALQLVLR